MLPRAGGGVGGIGGGVGASGGGVGAGGGGVPAVAPSAGVILRSRVRLPTGDAVRRSARVMVLGEGAAGAAVPLPSVLGDSAQPFVGAGGGGGGGPKTSARQPAAAGDESGWDGLAGDRGRGTGGGESERARADSDSLERRAAVAVFAVAVAGATVFVAVAAAAAPSAAPAEASISGGRTWATSGSAAVPFVAVFSPGAALLTALSSASDEFASETVLFALFLRGPCALVLRQLPIVVVDPSMERADLLLDVVLSSFFFFFFFFLPGGGRTGLIYRTGCHAKVTGAVRASPRERASKRAGRVATTTQLSGARLSCPARKRGLRTVLGVVRSAASWTGWTGDGGSPSRLFAVSDVGRRGLLAGGGWSGGDGGGRVILNGCLRCIRFDGNCVWCGSRVSAEDTAGRSCSAASPRQRRMERYFEEPAALIRQELRSVRERNVRRCSTQSGTVEERPGPVSVARLGGCAESKRERGAANCAGCGVRLGEARGLFFFSFSVAHRSGPTASERKRHDAKPSAPPRPPPRFHPPSHDVRRRKQKQQQGRRRRKERKSERKNERTKERTKETKRERERGSRSSCLPSTAAAASAREGRGAHANTHGVQTRTING